MFIEVSYTKNINTWEKFFAAKAFKGLGDISLHTE